MAWWLYPAWFFAPDLSILAYLVNTRVGAVTYNIVHHKGLAVVIYLIGLYIANTELLFTGLVLFGHSAFDRLCGYGLKYPDDFKHTHLGWIGKQ